MLLKFAYLRGVNAAQQKLGTASGGIPYSPRNSSRNPQFDYTANKRNDLWSEFDQSTLTTGEESSLGMPSPGGANKTGGVEDGQYSMHDGPYAQGGFDHNLGKPDELRDQILSSAIEEAFQANQDYDVSYGPESAMTQPHGSSFDASKLAAPATTMGMGASLTPSTTTGVPSASSMMGGALKPPKVPGAPQMPSPPKPQDSRLGKGPGAGLQQGLASSIGAADSASNFASPQKRLIGSVV